ncbi:hypothetical protein HY251_15600, partial [bacterium]|nr:hypothetical protein [bacterium]
QRAIAEGEARWNDRDELIDRAKRLAGTVGSIAEKARDAARDKVQSLAKKDPSKDAPASQDKPKEAST